jgi:hypothetical protein
MPTHEEHILRILGEATDPMFPSEITELLNTSFARALRTQQQKWPRACRLSRRKLGNCPMGAGC